MFTNHNNPKQESRENTQGRESLVAMVSL